VAVIEARGDRDTIPTSEHRIRRATAARSLMATIDQTRITKPSPIVEDEQGQLRARQGISREVVSELSKIKGEPDWMIQKRIKSLENIERKPVPTWGPDLGGLNLDDLVLYSPPHRRTFQQLGRCPH
jgi:hypothetical protein